MNEKEMVKRYVYEVTKRVPQESREDIRMELQALIDDMCAEEDLSVKDTLQKLGSPEKFAKRYREDSSCLIGPQFYDSYIWIMKITLAGIGISAVLSAIIQGILHTESIVRFATAFFQELFATAINGTCSMAGIITIIFAVIEKQKAKGNINPGSTWPFGKLPDSTAAAKPWTPDQLPPVPDKRAVISRPDSVISIILISVFSALLLFAPQLFGEFHYENGRITNIACVFNLDKWPSVLPVFLLWLLAGLADEIIRLISGHYCRLVMYSSLVCNTLQLVFAAVLLKVLPLWNPDFADQLKAAFGIHQYSKGDILYYWGSDLISNIVLAVICLATLAETGITVYKTLKYSRPRS